MGAGRPLRDAPSAELDLLDKTERALSRRKPEGPMASEFASNGGRSSMPGSVKRRPTSNKLRLRRGAGGNEPAGSGRTVRDCLGTRSCDELRSPRIDECQAKRRTQGLGSSFSASASGRRCRSPQYGRRQIGGSRTSQTPKPGRADSMSRALNGAYRRASESGYGQTAC